ncbi:MAG: cobalamin biosynthesis protein CobW [Roseovarius sp.]|nr:cobalamin biosynthesis protein CobW [Roseovarius sp.]
MPEKIPATIITGFLGAGKTTLIRNLLENAGGRRIALVINEFGDIGVDGGILKGCGISGCDETSVTELSNGCICCTVADDFIPAMNSLLERENPPEHIVIETSGLALPQPLVRAFGWPDMSSRVTVDGVVAVVDGKAVAEGRFAHSEEAVNAQRLQDENLDHDSSLAELFEDQISCADLIVINKTDLLNSEESENLAGNLRDRSRPGVQVVGTSMGILPADVLLGRGGFAENDMDARGERHHDHHHDGDHHHDHHHDHGHEAFESFSVTAGEIENAEDFAGKAGDVVKKHGILRLKGFAAVKGKPMRLVLQAVGPRVDYYYDRPYGPGQRETQLVVIGRAGLDRDAVTSDLGGSC